MDVNIMIKEALAKLGEDCEPQPNGMFVGLLVVQGLGWLKSQIEYFEEDRTIGVELYHRLLFACPEDNMEEVKEKLKTANEDPRFLEEGKRWLKMGLTTSPAHIAIVAEIRCPPNGFSKPYVYLKFCEIIELAEKHWPVPKQNG